MDWNQRYLDQHTPWDLWAPAIPLQDLLASDRFPMPRGARILVPGSGRGHCALALAESGYRVDGIDVAPEAVRFAERAARERGLEERARFHLADLFEVPRRALPEFRGAFDGVYELTCYCAIPRERREDYLEAVLPCLAPGGTWFGILFPTDGRTDGPPYHIEESELAAEMAGRGLEQVARFVPERTDERRRGKEVAHVYRRCEPDSGTQRAGELAAPSG